MRVRVSPFWLPGAGRPDEEYEDAFHPRRSGGRWAASLRLAVADGASESMLSGLWADLLVRTWCRGRWEMAEVLSHAMAAWEAEVAGYIGGRERGEGPIQWFEEPGLAKGAHDALLGVQLTAVSPTTARWSAVAMGDCCLFHVRGEELVRSFPLQRSEQFGCAPKLVPSRTEQLDRVLANLDEAEGDCCSGDALFLATDAMAAWFLAAVEEGEAPWRAWRELQSDAPEPFAAWAGQQRDRCLLRNDDLTLLRVEATEE